MEGGIDRVIARMGEIEDRISQLSGQQPQTASPGSFADALTNAQGGSGGSANGNNSLPPLPVAPDGETVRPLSTPASMTGLAPLVQQSAGKYGLDPDLLSAVIQAESGGNPRAVSKAGAMGLMQLMPATVNESGISDPFDPAQNIDAGSRKLSDLLNEYGGNVDLALAAYNAGSGAVKRYGGVPPYKETLNYIRRIHEILGNG